MVVVALHLAGWGPGGSRGRGGLKRTRNPNASQREPIKCTLSMPIRTINPEPDSGVPGGAGLTGGGPKAGGELALEQNGKHERPWGLSGEKGRSPNEIQGGFRDRGIVDY